MRASYDENADVLYVVATHPTDIEGEGLPRGVELDFSVDDARPCGVTVIGYLRNGWDGEIGLLSAIVGRHLTVPSDEVLAIINKSVS